MILISLFILVACDKPSQPPRESSKISNIAADKARGDSVKLDDVLVDLEGLVESLEEESSPEVEIGRSRADKHEEQNVPVKEVRHKPLDISAAFEEGVTSGKGYDFSRKNTLPDLFEQQKKEEGVSFSGKLINDPANPDYFDSLEGAEFSIEVKTR
ncbi:hypothetical protein ACJJID_04785 [Microbulbifer sp. CnH-101-G]|uniref:hypothetical protein n=1 Tax=Microbulbifer sp. CnH-101-G TaxID=3243393 RepID=UPI00403916F1